MFEFVDIGQRWLRQRGRRLEFIIPATHGASLCDLNIAIT
jgi:hypothetical protein